MAGIESDFKIPQAEGQRTLAAIVFTDAVGFSSRMNEDEDKALGLLREDTNRMHAICVSHGGSVLKFTGDGLLMYFQSAVQAVTCALKIQNTQAEIEKITPAENCMQHRIGIHLGDVLVSEGDVLGDGVNIAARLQHEAKSGGICISQTVYDVVKNKIALKAKYLGPRELKNISESVPIYELLIGFEEEEEDMDVAVNDKSNVPTASSAKPEQQSSHAQGSSPVLPALAGALVVGILVLIGLFAMLYFNKPAEPAPVANNATSAPAATPAAQAPVEPQTTQAAPYPANSNADSSGDAIDDIASELSAFAGNTNTPSSAASNNPEDFFGETSNAKPSAPSTSSLTVSAEELDNLLTQLSSESSIDSASIKPANSPESTLLTKTTTQPTLAAPAEPINLQDLGNYAPAKPATAFNTPAPSPEPVVEEKPPAVLEPPADAKIITSLLEGRSLDDDSKARTNKNMENTINQSRNLRLLAAWIKSSLVSYTSIDPLRFYWQTQEGYVRAETWADNQNVIYVRWAQETEEFELMEIPPSNIGDIMKALINDRARQGITPSQRVLVGTKEFTSSFALPELRKDIAAVVALYPSLQRHDVF